MQKKSAALDSRQANSRTLTKILERKRRVGIFDSERDRTHPQIENDRYINECGDRLRHNTMPLLSAEIPFSLVGSHVTSRNV